MGAQVPRFLDLHTYIYHVGRAQAMKIGSLLWDNRQSSGNTDHGVATYELCFKHPPPLPGGLEGVEARKGG